MGLHVQTGAVHVGAQDQHAVPNRLLADAVQHEALAHLVEVDLVARLQALHLQHVGETSLLGGLDGGLHAFALGLAVVEKALVVLNQFLFFHQNTLLLVQNSLITLSDRALMTAVASFALFSTSSYFAQP